jgi:mucin-2
MLVVAALGAWSVPGTVLAAAVNNGTFTLAPENGDSATSFTIDPDDAQVCPGDAATDNYRWQTFIVAASNDPAVLTYGSTGPNNATGFSDALRTTAGTRVVNKAPDPGTGFLSGIPTFSYSAYPSGHVPAGDYEIGIACTLLGVTESFWMRTITVTTPGGGTGQFDWALSSTPPSTTTTTTGTGSTTTTTTGTGSTTTTTGTGSTTTTTTTTTGTGSTTTTTGTGSTTTTTTAGTTGGAPSGTPPFGSVGSLAFTGVGSRTLGMVVWGLLFLVFGRMSILLARPIRVVPVATR